MSVMVQDVKRFHCVGCGRPIPWNGKGTLAFTCICGATLFADEEGKYSLPSSLTLGVVTGKLLPHMDHYLGVSNYVSMEKQRAFEELGKFGCIWSWDCPECKDETVKLRKAQIKDRMIRFEVHPELKALIDKS